MNDDCLTDGSEEKRERVREKPHVTCRQNREEEKQII